jgi:hypothetical protein
MNSARIFTSRFFITSLFDLFHPFSPENKFKSLPIELASSG